MEVLELLKQDDLNLFEENLELEDLEICDVNGQTLLHHAVSLNKYEFVDFLIERGADPNARDRKGNTPLHVAADKDADEIFELLLQYGGDLDIKNNSQRTAEQIAQISKSKKVLSIIQHLLEGYGEETGHKEKIAHHRRWSEEY
jgi:ankyrin repeat protein